MKKNRIQFTRTAAAAAITALMAFSGCAKPTGNAPAADGKIPFRADPAIGIMLEQGQDYVRIGAGNQRVEFTKGDSGSYAMTTSILKGEAWTPFFDAGRPLIQGESFNAEPTSYKVVSNTADTKAVVFSGTHPSKGYDFEIRVEAFAGSPLIRFTITNHLKSKLQLNDYEPLMMLWRDGVPTDRVSINQEVPNYQTVDDTAYWKSGFPSSYFYTDGMESAVYFNMSPMTWYSMNGGVKRFKVSQVRTIERDGAVGCGMDLRAKNSGKDIAAGDMTVEFYLYGNSRETVPTKLEALDASVNAFAYALQSTVEWPVNYKDGTLSYEFYAEKTIEGLMAENVTFKWQTPRSGRAWTDEPLFPDRTIAQLIQRPGYIPNTGTQSNQFQDFWGDWNCNNNTLIPWIPIERLIPDSSQRSLIAKATEGLLAYFDRTSSMFRSFDVHPGYEGSGLEFTFQNFFMQQGALWASDLTDPEAFDPALGGKFIQAMQGIMTLAHNCRYVFPQLVDVTRLIPATSIDEKRLGVTYEVWSGCLYAYNMCLAYDLTGSEEYLTEAETALDKLFNGMDFYVNSLKEKKYTDPYEFPINEVSTAPWGVAAAQRLYGITGDAKFLTYSDAIRNVTLRMMNWFESALADDPVDRNVGSIAFFHAFSVTDTTCPWESIMTYLPMLTELKNPDKDPSQVLLKSYNLFRINAFRFSGASWDPAVVESAKNYQKAVSAYYVPENYYSAESPTMPGLFGANSYMSNTLLYAYLMYEGYAEADNRDMMVLNLDIADSAFRMANGLERNFLVLNPLDARRKFSVRFKDLEDSSKYRLTLTAEDGKKTEKALSGKDLMNGYAVTLDPMEYLRMSVVPDDRTVSDTAAGIRAAQVRLMEWYAAMQTIAWNVGTEGLEEQKAEYEAALALYRDGKYAECAAKAEPWLAGSTD